MKGGIVVGSLWGVGRRLACLCNKNDNRKYISEAVSNLKGLTIETFDAELGRPSLINFDNQRVFEG